MASLVREREGCERERELQEEEGANGERRNLAQQARPVCLKEIGSFVCIEARLEDHKWLMDPESKLNSDPREIHGTEENEQLHERPTIELRLCPSSKERENRKELDLLAEVGYGTERAEPLGHNRDRGTHDA